MRYMIYFCGLVLSVTLVSTASAYTASDNAQYEAATHRAVTLDESSREIADGSLDLRLLGRAPFTVEKTEAVHLAQTALCSDLGNRRFSLSIFDPGFFSFLWLYYNICSSRLIGNDFLPG